MRYIYLSLFLAALFFVPNLVRAEVSDSLTAPEIIALLNHADWCGSCKILDPQINEARKNGLDSKNVVFVRMDYTDDVTTHQSAMLANMLGLKDIFEKNNKKTGYMALIKADTMEEIGRIDKTMDAAAISEMIESKL